MQLFSHNRDNVLISQTHRITTRKLASPVVSILSFYIFLTGNVRVLENPIPISATGLKALHEAQNSRVGISEEF